jgi:hypothetical protein
MSTLTSAQLQNLMLAHVVLLLGAAKAMGTSYGSHDWAHPQALEASLRNNNCKKMICHELAMLITHNKGWK